MYLLHIQKKRPIHYAIILGLAVFLIPVVSYAFLPQINQMILGGGSVFQGIGQAILSMVGVLTGFGGWLLNYAIYWVVVDMGSFLRDSGIDNQIGVIWGVIRDIANIAFVFGLIFIGFQTILNIETINTKKTLVAIIVGALLINFSLFFTKVVIDVSNLFAVEVYELFEVADTEDHFTYGIAGSFMQAMGMNTIFPGGGFGDLTTFNATFMGNIAFFFMAMIFLLVAAFVFLAGAVLLIIRFVALIMIMIFSPIMFAGMVFPQTQAAAKGLWGKLVSYSFFAPLYLFLLLISLLVLDQTRLFFSGSFSGAFANAEVGAFPILLNYTIGIVLLTSSLIIAKNLSIVGADRAMAIGKNLARNAPTYTGARRGGRLLAREASRKIRNFELQKKEGQSAAGKVFRKLPFVRSGLQRAGAYSKSQVDEQTKSLDGLRNSQLKGRLETYMAQEGATPLDRLAVYNKFMEKGDTDELDVDQVQDYFKLLNNYGLSTLKLRKLRADAFETPEEIDASVARMKNAGDVRNLHKRTVTRDINVEGAGGVSQDERNEQVDAYLDSLIKHANGGMTEGIGRRNDELTKEFVKRLESKVRTEYDDILDRGTQIDNSHIAEYYKKRAEEMEEVDEELARKHWAAADYWRSNPAGRLFGIEKGRGDEAAGDEDGGEPEEGDS